MNVTSKAFAKLNGRKKNGKLMAGTVMFGKAETNNKGQVRIKAPGGKQFVQQQQMKGVMKKKLKIICTPLDPAYQSLIQDHAERTGLAGTEYALDVTDEYGGLREQSNYCTALTKRGKELIENDASVLKLLESSAVGGGSAAAYWLVKRKVMVDNSVSGRTRGQRDELGFLKTNDVFLALDQVKGADGRQRLKFEGGYVTLSERSGAIAPLQQLDIQVDGIGGVEEINSDDEEGDDDDNDDDDDDSDEEGAAAPEPEPEQVASPFPKGTTLRTEHRIDEGGCCGP